MNQSQRHPRIAFAAAGIGIATFSAMDVAMKGLALEVGAYNAMLWRSIVAVVLAGILFLWHRPAWPTRRVARLHVWRGFIISIMTFLFFWGLKYLPVAEAIGLTFIAPLIALYLARILLKEEIGKQAIAASLIGLFGAAVIIVGRLRGSYDEETGKGIVAILISAGLYAYNLILQRQQSLLAGPVEIAFFQNCTLITLFSCLAPFLAVIPTPNLIPVITAAAFLGLVSLLMMSWAYARASASTLIPVEYTAFIWAALFGWLAFGETVTAETIIGTVLIVIGCFVATRKQSGHIDHVETTVV
jgi:S-adenosylmethionine uptake transporter